MRKGGTHSPFDPFRRRSVAWLAIFDAMNSRVRSSRPAAAATCWRILAAPLGPSAEFAQPHHTARTRAPHDGQRPPQHLADQCTGEIDVAVDHQSLDPLQRNARQFLVGLDGDEPTLANRRARSGNCQVNDLRVWIGNPDAARDLGHQSFVGQADGDVGAAGAPAVVDERFGCRVAVDDVSCLDDQVVRLLEIGVGQFDGDTLLMFG